MRFVDTEGGDGPSTPPPSRPILPGFLVLARAWLRWLGRPNMALPSPFVQSCMYNACYKVDFILLEGFERHTRLNAALERDRLPALQAVSSSTASSTAYTSAVSTPAASASRRATAQRSSSCRRTRARRVRPGRNEAHVHAPGGAEAREGKRGRACVEDYEVVRACQSK